ncbi:hypothetical protein EON81_26120 [bacterium]|nr:MAG: hypothetical protein EON81_26120 [bacterium]
MKKSLGVPAIATVAVLAIAALGAAVYFGVGGEPEPTAQNVPDYSKMSPAEVSESYGKGKQAESDAVAQKPK